MAHNVNMITLYERVD